MTKHLECDKTLGDSDTVSAGGRGGACRQSTIQLWSSLASWAWWCEPGEGTASGSQAHSYSGHWTLHSYLGSGHHQEATSTLTGDQAVAGGGHIYAIKDRRLSPGTCRYAAADISHCKSLGGGQHLWGITVPWLTADWVMVARARIRFPERLQPPAIWPTVVVVGAVVQTARPASCSCADSAVETVHSSPPPRPAPSSPQSGETNRGDTTAAISWADHCWSPVGSEEREEVPPSQLHWIVMHLSHLMNDMRNTTNEWIPLNQRMFLSFVENEQSS